MEIGSLWLLPFGVSDSWQSTPVFLPGESLWTEESHGHRIPTDRVRGSQRVRHDWTTKHSTVHDRDNNIWRREGQSILVFLPRESHGQRSLVGYSPWGHKETELLSHFRGTGPQNGHWLKMYSMFWKIEPYHFKVSSPSWCCHETSILSLLHSYIPAASERYSTSQRKWNSRSCVHCHPSFEIEDSLVWWDIM